MFIAMVCLNSTDGSREYMVNKYYQVNTPPPSLVLPSAHPWQPSHGNSESQWTWLLLWHQGAAYRYRDITKIFHILNPLKHGRFSDLYFKVLWEGVKTKFLDFFFHRGIRNKKVCKVKNFQVWVLHDNFEQQAKRKGLRALRG